MTKLLSAVALAAGIWLIYLGYERQQSLEGKAASTFQTIGQKIDGADHTPMHTQYYVAGAVLFIVGVFGLGIVRK
jgi:ABC-type Na+ efflux pump permease subunit